jgi:hypothetical protein
MNKDPRLPGAATGNGEPHSTPFEMIWKVKHPDAIPLLLKKSLNSSHCIPTTINNQPKSRV